MTIPSRAISSDDWPDASRAVSASMTSGPTAICCSSSSRRVPTILRANGFEIRIFTNDHKPAHVHGYKAGVFEFISPDHTDKNLMIAAHRRAPPRDPAPLRAQLRELMDFHGLREQRLARLLGEL